ncbi:MAG: hypothetical protein ACJ74Z_15520 [Bryobacteraceae bacterium]
MSGNMGVDSISKALASMVVGFEQSIGVEEQRVSGRGDVQP